MVVLVCKKGSFDSITYRDVSNIAYNNGNVVITHGGTTNTYAVADYMISILTV